MTATVDYSGGSEKNSVQQVEANTVSVISTKSLGCGNFIGFLLPKTMR